MPPEIAFGDAAGHLAAALLVGVLIGGQREATPGSHPGLRDFLLITLAGGVCGVLGNAWLSAAVLLGIAALLAIFHFEEREQRSGITTELAGISAYLLALLAASPQVSWGRPVAIGIAILAAVFLEAKQRLQHLLRETITESEFNATLTFVTVVLVVYPLLPPGAFGPYQFFAPRQIWMFVILVSSISYCGYFLEKFLGQERGLVYTSVLGGLASTTAATLHFARLSRQDPQATRELLRGFLIANSVQFPRTLLILAVVNRDLALASAWPLGLMTLAGACMAALAPRPDVQSPRARHENPFRLAPALRFGALFTAIAFLTKLAIARAGPEAFLGTSLIGGLVDVATVIAPASDLLSAQRLSLQTAEYAVLAALAANGALKLGLAAFNGAKGFSVRVALAYVLWIAAAGAGLMITAFARLQ